MITQLRKTRLACRTLALAFLIFAVTPHLVGAQSGMSDQQISDKIDDELTYDRGVVSTKIDTSASDGIVTLSGDVSNLLAKERAVRIAEGVKGVRAVVDRVEVSPAVTRSDAQIRGDVEAALFNDPATESFEITTTVENGEVELTGTVDSYQERELVKTVAKGVRGVTSIKDQIAVDYKVERADQEIRSEVEQTLRWNTHIDDFLIEVSVKDGKVSLSGTVGSAAEKRMAENLAGVAGVTAIDGSKLSVSKWARDEELRGDKYVIKSESEIRDAVEDALLQDPRVSSFGINVTVTGSIVTLRGDVDNLRAKRAAARDAKNTVGVYSVDNRLDVRLDVWPDDSEIAGNIREALLRDPYVERFDITISVSGGTAHLYGTVDSYFEKNRADNVAAGVVGVLDVANHLSVTFDVAYIYNPYTDLEYVDDLELIGFEQRTSLKTDSEVRDSIESEMWWSPFVDSDEVTVFVDDGVVTLTGTVDTWGERQSATENAYEGGATLVDNDLVVRD